MKARSLTETRLTMNQGKTVYNWSLYLALSACSPSKRQRISQEALRTMREAGAACDTIVSSLIGGNVEYERRTEHSKVCLHMLWEEKT